MLSGDSPGSWMSVSGPNAMTSVSRRRCGSYRQTCPKWSAADPSALCAKLETK